MNTFRTGNDNKGSRSQGFSAAADLQQGSSELLIGIKLFSLTAKEAGGIDYAEFDYNRNGQIYTVIKNTEQTFSRA